MRTTVRGCVLFSMLGDNVLPYFVEKIALGGGVCCDCSLSLCPSRAVFADYFEVIDACNARVRPHPPPPVLPIDHG